MIFPDQKAIDEASKKQMQDVSPFRKSVIGIIGHREIDSLTHTQIEKCKEFILNKINTLDKTAVGMICAYDPHEMKKSDACFFSEQICKEKHLMYRFFEPYYYNLFNCQCINFIFLSEFIL